MDSSLTFDFLRSQIVGIDSAFETPFGRRLMVYCDYTASGRCLLFVERYLPDPELLADVRGLVAKGRVFDPQRYAPDMSLRRRLDIELTERNQVRKFARFYPKPTDTSF